MNYSEVLDYMYRQLPMFHRIGAAAYKANLDNTHAICKLLGNPELKFPSIHIAGTNGKGSTSNLIASVLQESGLKTALFTSPHLKEFRERIRVNGIMIPEEKIIEFVENYREVFEEIKPSFFEWTFGLAVHYFAEQKVDIAVIETGMGGRLDSTNVVSPLITIITNIGFDHMAFLGDKLETIAIEKAGIIKDKVPVIIGETHRKTSSVFIETAKLHNSKIQFADKNYFLRNIKLSEATAEHLILDVYDHKKLIFEQLYCPLTGNYQYKNIRTAFAALTEINKTSFKLSEEAIRAGFSNVLKNTGFMGRWQKLQEKPLVICDTAHNEAGIKLVVKQLSQQSFKHLHFILGMVNDKEIDQILELLPKRATYYFCKADIPRGLDTNFLAGKAILKGLRGACYPSVKKAYDAAMHNSTTNDLIFIGGSTFTVAEILNFI